MVYIIKANNKKEKFQKRKIQRTCVKAGASQELAKKIANKVEKKVKKGTTTGEILNFTLRLLKENPVAASIYDLKRAIMSLGPEGFVFEEFFSQLLKNYGYETKINNFIKGKIIEHEVDIIAKKKLVSMVECKYHNKTGNHTNSKVAMYTYARFLDIKSNKKNKLDFPWLVTNTKCTPHAVQYAKGVKLKITSWEYPKKESLQILIEKKKLYPITILNIHPDIKEKLTKAKIVLAKSLIIQDFNQLKKKTGIKDRVLRKLIEEANKIISS